MNSVDFVLRLTEALDRLFIPYMLVGSFSSNVYGRPRSTKDADIVVELADKSIMKLVAELGPEAVLDPQLSFETITATTRYRIRHRDTPFVIELFLLSDDRHDRERFTRRVAGDVSHRRVFVPTAEDVVITKLRWSKDGKRQKDIDDVRDVLTIQHGRLDLTYTRTWCNQHGTRDLLEQLLEEVEDRLKP